MVNCHVPLWAFLLFTLICSASPVKKNSNNKTDISNLDVQKVSNNVLKDLNMLNLGTESTFKDLIDKVSPVLSRYPTHHGVTRIALKYLVEEKGVDSDTMDRYGQHRANVSNRISGKKWESQDKNRNRRNLASIAAPPFYSSSREPIPEEWGGFYKSDPDKDVRTSRRVEQRRLTSELELQDLSDRIKQHGLEDETDYEVFLRNEEKLQPKDMSKRKLSLLLGEYMRRTKGLQGWTAGYVHHRQKVRWREYRKTNTTIGAQKGRLERNDSLGEDSQPMSTKRAASDAVARSKSDKDIIQFHSKPSLRPRKQRRYKMISSDSEEGFEAGGTSDTLPSRIDVESTNNRPRKQRPARKSDEKSRASSLKPKVKATQEHQPVVHLIEVPDERFPRQKRKPNSSYLPSGSAAKRPTTGGKTFTGSSSTATRIHPHTSQLKLKVMTKEPSHS